MWLSRSDLFKAVFSPLHLDWVSLQVLQLDFYKDINNWTYLLPLLALSKNFGSKTFCLIFLYSYIDSPSVWRVEYSCKVSRSATIFAFKFFKEVLLNKLQLVYMDERQVTASNKDLGYMIIMLYILSSNNEAV